MYGLSPGSGTVSFKFLILFVMERAEPVSVDAFAVELFVHECEINGKGYLELALAVLSGCALPRAEFVNSKGRERRLIITMITNTRQVADASFDSDIPCILLPFIYIIFFYLLYLIIPILTMINFVKQHSFATKR